MTRDINSTVRFRYFALNQLRIKCKKCFKFYHRLILLPRDVSLNPGPNQYLPGNDNKFKSLNL